MTWEHWYIIGSAAISILYSYINFLYQLSENEDSERRLQSFFSAVFVTVYVYCLYKVGIFNG